MCKWIEAGTTIDTALPEIGNLTDDKKEWRAVIVRYIDDNCMAAFESDVRNPYDFLINRDAEDSVEESPIPLVRLTQMLGGVPPLEIKFKAEILREAHKAPRTIYVPIENTQRERAHKELTAKYAFDGKLPSSILIISVRSKSYQAESLGRSWLAHKESESSEFWKRNHFPSICRFMVYDIEKQGPIQKEADDFGFWYSVMLMAINEWDSSTIQAYRLYTLGVFMNSDAMSESFHMCLKSRKSVASWRAQEMTALITRMVIRLHLQATKSSSNASGRFGPQQNLFKELLRHFNKNLRIFGKLQQKQIRLIDWRKV